MPWLMVALPISLMCGFAEPLLRLWLGPGSAACTVALLMAAHLCINVPIMPLLGLQLATNRVKVPAVVTMVMGIANLGLALVLAGPVHWNLYGIAAAGRLCLRSKMSFSPPFTPHTFGQVFGGVLPELALIAGCFGQHLVVPGNCSGFCDCSVGSIGDSRSGRFSPLRTGRVPTDLDRERRKMVRALVPFGRS